MRRFNEVGERFSNNNGEMVGYVNVKGKVKVNAACRHAMYKWGRQVAKGK